MNEGIKRSVPAYDRKKLYVAVISKSNEDGGGASRMATSLARMLNQCENVLAHHWIGYPGKTLEPQMKSLYNGPGFPFFQLICRLFSQIIGLPDFLTPEIFNLWNRKNIDYDIYHFHDISRTFSPIAFRWLARRRPVAWTFRDCSPFTGGCLYPMECKAFQKRCGKCPRLREWPLQTFIDFTGIMQDYKRTTARMQIFTPITASQWTAEQTMKSGMFSTRPYIIPNYVDLDVFRPLNKRVLKKKLGLPADRFIIMISAPNLHEKRKGARYALTAISRLNRKVEILIIGKIKKPYFRKYFGNNPIHELGYIKNHSLLAQYYAASDVFLFPSLAETFCNAILESMACGTPPIAFNIGAIPELITHKKNGWLAEAQNVEELIEGLQFLFDNPELRIEWGKMAREEATHYDQKKFIDAHLKLYKRMLKKNKIGLI